MPTPLEQASDAIQRARGEGIQEGMQRAQAEFFGTAAAVLPLMLLADAAQSIGQRIRQFNPQVADFFNEQARLYTSLAAPPRVIQTSPQADAAGVSVDTAVSVQFENPLSEESVSDSNVFLMADSGGPHITATLGWDPDTNTASLVPASSLTGGVTYRITAKGTVTNQAGMEMAQDFTSKFTTVSSG